MGQDKADISIARIERALARIEAAADRPATSPSMPDDGEVSQLRRAHRALRGRVEGAITELDGLLAAGEHG
jgi:hypothetical protein